MPAKTGGPLEHLSFWIGKKIESVSSLDAGACDAALNFIAPSNQVNGRLEQDWVAYGWARAGKRATIVLIAIVDSDDTVLGFGLPGFNSS
jgi:hypothetical protein